MEGEIVEGCIRYEIDVGRKDIILREGGNIIFHVIINKTIDAENIILTIESAILEYLKTRL
jgi:hypothetical protein